MKIILTNIIEIQEPTQQVLEYCKKNLTFSNPDYVKKQRLGFWVGKTPKQLKLYDIYNSNVYLPIGCFDDIWEMHPYKQDYKDYSVVVPRNITSDILLREYQKPCVDALKKYVNGIFLLFAGAGKTNIALQCASELKQHTLFLVHTKELLTQAKERCENNLHCTTSEITSGKCNYSGDIVFATVQTLVNFIDKGEIPQNEFGLVVTDECHHLSTNAETVKMFEKCVNYFCARYKIGLTATLHRADGLEKTTTKILGNVIYELKKDTNKGKYIGIYEGKEILELPLEQFQVPARVYMLKSTYKAIDKDIFDRNSKIVFSKLITSIATDYDRNKIVLDIINKVKGYTLVISERVDQLEYLHNNTPNSIFISGSTKKKEREQLVNDFRNGEYRVMFASYSLVAEGLDIPMLENLIMASPVKDSRLVIQSVGRVQRPYKGKNIANVYDIIDDVSLLDKFTRERKKVYKNEGWDIL